MKFSRLKFAFFSFLMVLSSPLFAQQDVMPPGMTNLANSILNIFTGGFTRAILAVFFCATAVTYAFNKDNEKMKRGCIAIGVAIGMIAAASVIVGTIFSASGA
jgi:type IV secretory pathway VirB2 component (pilin)